MNERSIVITPADKGGHVVIMDRWEYNIAIIRLFTGSDSHYMRRKVSMLRTQHTGILGVR